MLVAMTLAAAVCIFIGSFPSVFYRLLPYTMEYVPYTTAHVLTQLQLLFFGALAVVWLMKTGIYPAELPAVNLDADWTYRWVAPRVVSGVGGLVMSADRAVRKRVLGTVRRTIDWTARRHGPQGILARTWPTGSMVLWVTVLLGAYLIFYLF